MRISDFFFQFLFRQQLDIVHVYNCNADKYYQNEQTIFNSSFHMLCMCLTQLYLGVFFITLKW